MARPKNQTPVYKLHKSTGLARCWVGGKWVTLGKYGSPESRAEFARIVAEIAVAPAPQKISQPDFVPTVDHVVLAFWKHAEKHYRRPDGTRTQEISEYKQALRILRRLYGHTLAKDFGPLALKAVRAEMVKKKWARTLINRRIGRVRRAFKWAASEQFAPVSTHHALGTVGGLQRGRSESPEMEPIQPVEWEHVVATLPFLRPHVAAMIQVQWLTGMRPGEVCSIRPCDIDTSAAVWVYRPPYSKMSYQGRQRVIAIGPRAQAVLRAFAPKNPSDFYFSPVASVERFHAERVANRKTPKYASHMKRNATKRVREGERKPAARYTNKSYGYAIRRAVARANWARIEAAVELEFHIPEWAPNQLRHSHGTAVRHRYDLESAQAVLGHERMSTTEIYAEKNLSLALKVASEMG